MALRDAVEVVVEGPEPTPPEYLNRGLGVSAISSEGDQLGDTYARHTVPLDILKDLGVEKVREWLLS